MGIKSSSITNSLKTALIALACLLVIAGGVAGMNKMASSKQEPEKKQKKARGLLVETIPVMKKEISLPVTGYGQAGPINITQISPEVSGKIIKTISLKEGETVLKGSLLRRSLLGSQDSFERNG